MSALRLISECTRLGIHFVVSGQQLFVSVGDDFPAGHPIVEELRKNKYEILNILNDESLAERMAIMLESGEIAEPEARERANVICMSEYRRKANTSLNKGIIKVISPESGSAQYVSGFNGGGVSLNKDPKLAIPLSKLKMIIATKMVPHDLCIVEIWTKYHFHKSIYARYARI